MAAGGEALVAFFQSDEGRAMLSREGRADDVQVREAVGVGDAFLMHVADRAVGDYWRALAGVRGRLVTISASGPEGQALQIEYSGIEQQPGQHLVIGHRLRDVINRNEPIARGIAAQRL